MTDESEKKHQYLDKDLDSMIADARSERRQKKKELLKKQKTDKKKKEEAKKKKEKGTTKTTPKTPKTPKKGSKTKKSTTPKEKPTRTPKVEKKQTTTPKKEKKQTKTPRSEEKKATPRSKPSRIVNCSGFKGTAEELKSVLMHSSREFSPRIDDISRAGRDFVITFRTLFDSKRAVSIFNDMVVGGTPVKLSFVQNETTVLSISGKKLVVQLK
ncbi:hypothetical protein ADUPG1_010791 [Aduncisulcus paluster]|uniref:RRM domain-containing protein n=1 Tax=Aduncisulcus paluster TaxID=2918883 RepID=A0ABQ5JV21_9EUKA|nr:hypothetical protein ADUPG1_010791 [Aduncisulcus paluster]|eukprot:gnl/Carplike_NY0171/1749_a2362_1315.p1 GENE.gnl/Carplike_NY0171/1749_a2362_1315~~gnl/Carplike_NY0171/1749_a2362_1315.p1  ORF type:complete len:223 (+),score=78.54 gnl/Carplike_NY0171/1749_a2362_1315:33-671(+)